MIYKDLIEKDIRNKDSLPTDFVDVDKERTNKMLERVQQEAFMEGYRYAIKVLEDGIVDKEKAK